MKRDVEHPFGYNVRVEYSDAITHNARRPIVRLYSVRWGVGFDA